MERDKEIPSMESLFSIAYADKKITKNQTRTIDINLIIESSNIDKLNLKKLSIVLLAVSKVFTKKMKSLIEDATHFYQLLSHCPAKRAPRAASSKNITLNIENSKLFINDEMVDFGEDDIIQNLESSILEQSFVNPAFEVDFGDAPSIEQVRNSTLISGEQGSNLFNDTTLSINIKRRKIVEDSKIEITENIFKSNLKSVTDILMKPKNTSIDISDSLVKVDRKIEEFLNSLKPQQPAAVEEHRQQEFDMDFDAQDVDFNPIEGSKDESASFKSDESIKEFLVFEDLASMPKNFVFNLLIQQLSRTEKSLNFLNLLNLAAEGKVLTKQADMFEPIECELTQ